MRLKIAGLIMMMLLIFCGCDTSDREVQTQSMNEPNEKRDVDETQLVTTTTTESKENQTNVETQTEALTIGSTKKEESTTVSTQVDELDVELPDSENPINQLDVRYASMERDAFLMAYREEIDGETAELYSYHLYKKYGNDWRVFVEEVSEYLPEQYIDGVALMYIWEYYFENGVDTLANLKEELTAQSLEAHRGQKVIESCMEVLDDLLKQFN